MVYHISKKFRDEARARGGLLRLREFIMKDAYTLDTGEEAFDVYYPKMLQAYYNIFERCGTPAVAINADTGAMGGKTSHEFVVPHADGEDTYIACANCDYAANVEAAEFVREGRETGRTGRFDKSGHARLQNHRRRGGVCRRAASQTIKAVFYWWTPPKTANGRFLFILVRGDLDINEVKLRNALGGGDVRPATDDEIRAAGAEPGYASPIGLNVAAAPELSRASLCWPIRPSRRAATLWWGPTTRATTTPGPTIPAILPSPNWPTWPRRTPATNARAAAGALRRGAAWRWGIALSWARATVCPPARTIWMKTAVPNPSSWGPTASGWTGLWRPLWNCTTTPTASSGRKASRRIGFT
jgi:hypothetical protein